MNFLITIDFQVGLAGVSRNPTKETFRLKNKSQRHANSCRVTAIEPPNPTYGCDHEEFTVAGLRFNAFP